MQSKVEYYQRTGTAKAYIWDLSDVFALCVIAKGRFDVQVRNIHCDQQKCVVSSTTSLAPLYNVRRSLKPLHCKSLCGHLGNFWHWLVFR